MSWAQSSTDYAKRQLANSLVNALSLQLALFLVLYDGHLGSEIGVLLPNSISVQGMVQI